MTAWVDRCMFVSATSGTADFQVASAEAGYLTPSQAGAVNGALYHYAAEYRDPLNNIISAWETGDGIWTASTSTLARTTVQFSSAANAKVNFTTAPTIVLTAAAADFGATGSGGITDAPNDASTYGRHAAAWVAVISATDTMDAGSF